MNRPLQALLIAGEPLWEDIIQDKKHISIRQGHRDYQVDRPLILCCHHLDHAVMTHVTAVRHTTLAEVTEEELWEDEFAGGHAEALEVLQQWYPELTLESEVTVLRWGKMEGRIIDHA